MGDEVAAQEWVDRSHVDEVGVGGGPSYGKTSDRFRALLIQVSRRWSRVVRITECRQTI